jgi:hypothetical protein
MRQSSTSPNTNLSYTITTLADCKSSNLMHQLQYLYMKHNTFYIGDKGQILSKWALVHMCNHELWPTVPIHTKSH